MAEEEISPMNHKQRVLAALKHHPYDRIPVKHEGTPEINQLLMDHFGVQDQLALLDCLGDDFRYVSPVWCGPELRTFPDGSWEGWWGERYNNISFGHGTYPESVYQPFANVTDVKELEAFRLPTADWFDYGTIKAQCEAYADHAVVFGGPDNIDVINSVARCRGVERVLWDIAEENPVYLALVEKRFRLYYEMHERALRAAGGLIDIVHVGDDLGTQNGLLFSPRVFDRIFAPLYEQYFAMAHRYGARTMMHSCGSVRQLIPRLIELGLDILDVVQVGAAGMALADLHRLFGDRLCFCGTVDVQSTLPFGTVEDVRREVEVRKALFHDGGLVLGPTHAIQVGTPLANILALYEAAGSL
jgi:uroporphyrinogen decarboxylase